MASNCQDGGLETNDSLKKIFLLTNDPGRAVWEKFGASVKEVSGCQEKFFT
jgi:hypothetical protein